MVNIQKVMNGYIVTDTTTGAKYVCATYAEVNVRVQTILGEINSIEAQFNLDKVTKGQTA